MRYIYLNSALRAGRSRVWGRFGVSIGASTRSAAGSFIQSLTRASLISTSLITASLITASFSVIRTGDATPPQLELPLRLQTLKAEAGLLQRLTPPRALMQKPTGEEVGSYDIAQVTLEMDVTSTLPSRLRARVKLNSMVDDLNRISFYILDATPDDVTVEVSYDAINFIPADITGNVQGGISVSLPQTLNTGDELEVSFTYQAPTWSVENPPSIIEQRELSHLVSSLYLPFNGQTFVYDYAVVETQIAAGPDRAPAALGALVSRPEPGEAGTWIYRSELPAIFYVYANGGGYPVDLDGRVEVFHPAEQLGSESAAIIEERSLSVVNYYEELYGFFPFARLGVAPISERAGAAIGPQAQILLPYFFWLDDVDLDATFDRAGVIYHEVAHQYFFNTIRLNPNPEIGQAWLSEAFAELSSFRALDTLNALDGGAALHRSVNFNIYLLSDLGSHPPIASVGVSDDPNYFTIVYLLGSTVLYGLTHRMEGYDARFRECVNAWSNLLIGSEDMFDCWRAMTPKAAYQNFDLERFIERYLTGVTLDEILVSARYVDEDTSELTLSCEEWPDALEIMVNSPNGDQRAEYVTRGPNRNLTYQGASARVDPIRTTPRRVINQNPLDVDLNGVIDGQDALDVLFHVGASVDNFERVFPTWADVDQDRRITETDLVEIARQIGSYQR